MSVNTETILPLHLTLAGEEIEGRLSAKTGNELFTAPTKGLAYWSKVAKIEGLTAVQARKFAIGKLKEQSKTAVALLGRAVKAGFSVPRGKIYVNAKGVARVSLSCVKSISSRKEIETLASSPVKTKKS